MDWFDTLASFCYAKAQWSVYCSVLLTGGNMQQHLWREVKLKNYATSTHSNHGKTISAPNASSVTLNKLIENESPLSSTVCGVFESGHYGRGETKTENDLNVFGFSCALSVQSGSSQFHVCPQCLLPKQEWIWLHNDFSLTHRIEKHELELGADWHEEISSRTVFAVDLFVCNRVSPRLSVICQLGESSGFS